MKAEIAKIWVDALRSGEYGQTRNWLKMDNDFCCLGLLCEISKLGEWQGESVYRKSYLGDNRRLPKEIKKWSGIRTNMAQLSKVRHNNLADLNDNGKTFLD